MKSVVTFSLGILVVAALVGLRCGGQTAAMDHIRFATFNIEDVRTVDLLDPAHPRLTGAAAVIQRLRPDILLVNELTYDYPELPSGDGKPPGSNALRFAETFLAVSQGPGLEPMEYSVFQPETNTGLHSGLDLDNSGDQTTTWQTPAPSDSVGAPPPQTREGRTYGNDSWGFGTFPGQYGMALFVRKGLRILTDSIRTFQDFRWSAMPDAFVPTLPDGSPWYSNDEWTAYRLSSKTHAVVPVMFEDGRVVSAIISHPTPPAFDGDEQRNKKRNHDEIRLLAAIVNDESYVSDDHGVRGGLRSGSAFVILGDLNADPDEGSTVGNPMQKFLLGSPRIVATFVPVADSIGITSFPRLDPDDTAQFGLRVDYVLPSSDFEIVGGGVYRPTELRGVSDHFPVWIDASWSRH